MSKKSEFHITIGASFENTENVTATVEHHLRLVKSAIFYADKVTLCSPIALLLTPILSMTDFTELQQIQLLEMVVPSIAQDEETINSTKKFCDMYRRLNTKQNFSVQNLHAKVFIKQAIRPFIDELKKTSNRMVEDYKLDQFKELMETGRVELKLLGKQLSPLQVIAATVQKAKKLESIFETGKFDVPALPGNEDEDIDRMMNDFLAELERAIKSTSSYPLFDDFTGNLVRLGLQEGKIDASEIQRNRAKPIGLAVDMMERLPTFEFASIGEILDIRKALDKPLLRFRGAMIKFSRDMKTASWDEDFPLEAEEVFRAEIEPSIAEMEDAVKSNKLLYELAHLLPEKSLSVVAGSALGAGFSTLSHLPNVVTASLGAATGLGVLTMAARKKWAEKQTSTENNQLFFYYKAGKMLEKKHN